jgi:hypothetical protein
MKKTLLLSLTLLVCSNSISQTFVSTSPQNRKVILEEFTGINCVFCPDGHTIANNIKNANPNNFFVINIHVGGFATPGAGQPDFRTSFGTGIAGQTGLTGYPSGTISRTVFPAFSMSEGGTAMGRFSWSNATNQILTQPSYVNTAFQANIDVNSRTLTVNTETYYTGNSPVGTNRLNLALMQNNTLGPQTGGNMGNNYNHQHRLIHMVTGQWGVNITPTTTGSFHFNTFTYQIPLAHNGVPIELGDLELVVFVAEGQQRIISGNTGAVTYSGLANNDVMVKGIAPISEQCSNSLSPKVTIQNLSQSNLTSTPIFYSVNGGPQQTYNWTGSIQPLQSLEVTLPAITYDLQANNTLVVTLPNDDNNTNNTLNRSFIKAVETQFTNISIKITLDRWASETSWTLKNSAGVNVAVSPVYNNGIDFAANGAYPQTDINLTLPNDCYTFEILDSYGDGMCCEYGNGGYQIWANGTLIPGMSGGTFTSSDRRIFGVNTALSVDDVELAAIKVYPNPTKGSIYVNLPADAQMTLTDLSGKVVMRGTLISGENQLTLQHLSKGMYLMQLDGEKFNKTEKIILN